MNTKPSEASPHDQSALASQVNRPVSSVDAFAQDEATGRPKPSATSLKAGSDASDAVERAPADMPAESAEVAAPTETVSQCGDAALVEDTRAPESRGRIQIGSRREKSPQALASPRPKTAGTDKPLNLEPPAARRTPVRPPSVREPLSTDLERQFAAAMGDASLDEILASGTSPQPVAELELESRQQSRVVRIHGDNVFFSLGGRHEGVASLRQFPQPPVMGAELEVIVRGYHADDGLYELLIPGASAHVEDWSDLAEGSMVEARITGANTGGLECKVGGLRGFIPSSQIAMFRVEDYAEFLEQKLLCVVTEVNPKRKNLVLSRRAVLEREKEEARKQLLESMEVGQVVEGVVRKILDFGAFVDIGGIDGLVHISQLSWDHVNHPNEVLQEGQKVRVKIEKVDRQTGKIGLSYRELLEHPWVHIDEKFPIDTVVTGTVSRIAKFGAFVKLAPGVEGLVHISELSYARVPSVGSVVSEGQEVEVKVLSVDPASQRIALSMKAVLPEPVAEEPESVAETPGESPREAAAAQRQAPLRGGMDRASGGEQFGLKW
jgi:predicted RNA-binding protein with RPS1 domain